MRGSALLRCWEFLIFVASLKCRLGGVGYVMRVLRSCAVLAAVGVAVFRAMFVEIFGPADSHTGSVAMCVAMAGPVLVAMLSFVVMAVLSSVLVTMVALVGSHEILQFIETV